MMARTPGQRPQLRRRGWAALLLALGLGAAGCGAVERESMGGGGAGENPLGGATLSGGQTQLGGSHAGGVAAGARMAVGAFGPDPGAGTGGAFARGGTGNIATGGLAGGGAGGDAGIDPACHCVLDEFGGFGGDCWLSLQDFFARVRAPASCENDLDFVIHASCSDGTTRYSWLEGSENDYILVFDQQGRPIYGSMSGYVGGVCSRSVADGTDGDGGWTISAGTAPGLSTCDTCTWCGNPNGEGGAGALCR